MMKKQIFILSVVLAFISNVKTLHAEEVKWTIEAELVQPFLPTIGIGRMSMVNWY